MPHPRLFLDTNVLVSAVLFGGVPGELVDAAREGRVEAVVSLHVLSEFIEVLTRPRFGVDESTAVALAEEIALFARVIPLLEASGARVSDADDDPVVEAAIAGGVTHVVTGDLRIHRVDVEGLEVITPAEALRVAEEYEAR
jgi:putative PIN family toxin of toxin-antitoxin system